jgi:P-type Cu+ transporter
MTMVKETYPLLGMECASCIRKIESILNKTEGIKEASANIASEKVTVEYDDEVIDLKRLGEILKNLGYELIA